MGWSPKIGTIFGTTFRLHLALIPVVAAFAWTGRFAEMAWLFATVVCHEGAHAAAARRLGMKVSEIELFPFGGVARIEELVQLNPMKETMVAAAGPMFNGLVAFVVAAVLFTIPVSTITYRHLTILFEVNVIMGGFNLLPAIPLDGGRLLRSWLVGRIGYRRGTALAVKVGRWVVVGLIALASLLRFANGVGGIGVSLIAVAIFVWVEGEKERRRAGYVWLVYLARRRSTFQAAASVPVRHLSVRGDVTVGEAVTWIVPDQYNLFWLVDEDGRVSQMVSEAEVVDVFFQHGGHGLLADSVRNRL